MSNKQFRGAEILHFIPPLSIILITAWMLMGARQTTESEPAGGPSAGAIATGLAPGPRVVFLGAGKCIPCQMMKPVREELLQDYGEQLALEYHDVWQDPAVGTKFGITTIPTTIFVDEHGREFHRFTGYMSLDDILGIWRKHGLNLNDL